MVTVEEVRALAVTLPRTSEHVIRDRLKFRVGAIVYVAFSRDETTMGFGFPKDERDALIAAEPTKFFPATRVRPALQLGVREARRDRPGGDGRARDRGLADVRAEEGRGRAARRRATPVVNQRPSDATS